MVETESMERAKCFDLVQAVITEFRM
jgi:hypothetical protein